jgi:methionyl-tRNA formyltransferase
LERAIRAFTPWPGVYAALPGRKAPERIKVLAAEVIEASGAPGTLLDDRLTVACGEGALRLVEVQKAGKASVEGAAFLRGARLAVGAVLPSGAER